MNSSKIMATQVIPSATLPCKSSGPQGVLPRSGAPAMKTASTDTHAHEASKEAQENELLEALDEALSCEQCQLAVTGKIMALDIERGAYITTHYPPYFETNLTSEDSISPFDTSIRSKDPSHWRRLTLPQRQRYYDLVEANLNQALDEKKPSTDPETAVLFAHYQVDYHIRQHYLARRGVLTLCRDAKDLQQLRSWQWKMTDIDAGEAALPASIEALAQRGWRWPNDATLEMTHQNIMWKRSSRARLKRVREVRARWAVIMEERRRQREELLRSRAKEGTLTVRLYCRGELWDVRELKGMAPVVQAQSVRVGRVTRSMGL